MNTEWQFKYLFKDGILHASKYYIMDEIEKIGAEVNLSKLSLKKLWNISKLNQKWKYYLLQDVE